MDYSTNNSDYQLRFRKRVPASAAATTGQIGRVFRTYVLLAILLLMGCGFSLLKLKLHPVTHLLSTILAGERHQVQRLHLFNANEEHTFSVQ